MVRKFVHPGYVRSATGAECFVSFPVLCELYGLSVDDPGVVNAQMGEGKAFKPEPLDQHFYPRADGDYPGVVG